MNFSEALSRFIIGGGMVTLISILGKSKNPQLAGMAVLFPAVTIIGYYFMGISLKAPQIKPIILFSLFALPSVMGFLITLYLTIDKFNIWVSLLTSLSVWLLVSFVILWADNHILHFWK